MTRSRAVSRALWTLVAPSALALGCGRLGFDEAARAEPTDAEVAAIAPAAFELPTLCGAPGAAALTVTNPGAAPLVIAGATASGGFSILTRLPITAAPGASIALDVMPPAAVIGTDRPGDTKPGALVLVTGDAREHTVALTARVTGAHFELADDTGDTPPLALTATYPACPPQRLVTIRNTGDVGAMFGLSTASTQLDLGGWVGGTVAAGASTSHAIDLVTQSACSGTPAVTYAISGAACDASPLVLQVGFTITGAGAAPCMCS